MTRININATDLSVLVIGRLEAKYSADGSRILRYYIDFRHKGLNIHKSLSAPEIYILQNKVDALIASWEKKYSEHQRRTAAYEGFAAGKGLADQISADANVRLTNLSNTLSHTLGIGGKIVIQAKRYTRTVGVSAVRDLYGAMQHENASRGILVTTADYGPDAYKFASGKPMTLLTGANLLHLLSKHGYHAKIDILEARREIERHNYGGQQPGAHSSKAQRRYSASGINAGQRDDLNSDEWMVK